MCVCVWVFKKFWDSSDCRTIWPYSGPGSGSDILSQVMGGLLLVTGGWRQRQRRLYSQDMLCVVSFFFYLSLIRMACVRSQCSSLPCTQIASKHIEEQLSLKQTKKTYGITLTHLPKQSLKNSPQVRFLKGRAE